MAKGIVAAGHQLTARAAEEVLVSGGNAFDAVIAAFFASCVSESVLASPGGGGFLLARKENQAPMLYDFFVQTPVKTGTKDLDFFPILADFGETQQEFHIGHGSVAVPGVMRGIFEVHRDLATMPMPELVQPAVDFVRDGIKINDFQAFIFDIVKPIFSTDKIVRQYFSTGDSSEHLLSEGDIYQPTPGQPHTISTLPQDRFRSRIARPV